MKRNSLGGLVCDSQIGAAERHLAFGAGTSPTLLAWRLQVYGYRYSQGLSEARLRIMTGAIRPWTGMER